MSGIGAICSAKGSRTSIRDTMLNSMSARARDGIGKWDKERVALGACILHTTKEAADDPQPHVSEDGNLAVVFDGYLTNAEELNRSLKERGVLPRSRSDGELILKAYQSWGQEWARYIEGEFAIIIADIANHQVIAARDHASLRPLFYTIDDGQLLIASDIGAIVNSVSSPISPNKDHLAGLMASSLFSRGTTVWNEIQSLLPAHTLTFKDGRVQLREFWSPPTDVTIRYDRDEEYFEHYREVLTDSVKRCARTHKPLAIAVSGGLDSTSLFCIADQLERHGALPAPSMQGYTLAGTKGTGSYELDYARAGADHVGRQLVEVPLFEPSIDWFTKQVETTRDIPTATNGAMTIGIEQRLVADGSVAFMNGDGGDEWLQGGIQYYRQFVSEGDWGGFLSTLRQDIPAYGFWSIVPQALRQLVATLPPLQARLALRKALQRWRGGRKRRDNFYWLKPEIRKRLAEIQRSYSQNLPGEPIDWIKHNLLTSPFTDLAHSMMQRQRGENGLEPRHPMLTRQFIEFSTQTPEHIKCRAGRRKFVHREALRDTLPTKVVERTTKADFASPILDQEFAAYMRDHSDLLLTELCDAQGLAKLISPETLAEQGDDVSWECWGVYVVGTFLYYCEQHGVHPLEVATHD